MSEAYPAAMPTANPAARKRRVFLVDDHPLVREWLASLITQSPDLEVCGETEDPRAAPDLIGAAHADAAVVDLTLGDASGLELIKNLRALHPNVAVVVLSMHEESLYAERALRAGARGYVMKRDTTKQILAALRTVLSGGVHVGAGFAAAMATRVLGQRNGEVRSPIEQLSDRELEVFRLLGRGRGTPQIAEALGLSLKTVQAYCARIKDKLGLSSMTGLLREAVRWDQENA